MKQEIKKAVDESLDGNSEAYWEAAAYAHSEAVSWNDIDKAVNTLPQYERAVYALIKGLLGYIPESYIRLPHETFLRASLHQHRSGGLSWDGLFGQAEECVKLMRNEEVKNHSHLTYGDDVRERYTHYLPNCRETVRNRLTKFLGYEPKLEHSMAIEIRLREYLISDRYHFSDEPTARDFQAINVIKYREVLLEKGKRAADASPLYAIDTRALYKTLAAMK